MKLARSLTHGGSGMSRAIRSSNDRPFTVSSTRSSLESEMFFNLRHAVLNFGSLHTEPFQPLSCHGTRMDTWCNGYEKLIMFKLSDSELLLKALRPTTQGQRHGINE